MVLDGDTLRLPGGERVRLAAIDTPERGRPLADRATALLTSLAGGGPVELVPADPPRDRYGRLLADVRIGGLSASEVLVGAGLAWVYIGGDERLGALQAAAVDAGVGVHGRYGRVAGELFVVTSRRFHRDRCPVLGGVARREATTDVASLFKSGRSPCRTCLRWPP